MRFSLPTGSLHFRRLSAAQKGLLRRAFPRFVNGGKDKPSRQDLTCCVVRLPRLPDISAEELNVNGYYVPRKVYAGGTVALTGGNFEALIEKNPSACSRSKLGVAQERDIANLGVIDNFLRVLVAYRALALDGVMLHSAGLVFDGRAFVFPGCSNAGKTTLTPQGPWKGRPGA